VRFLDASEIRESLPWDLLIDALAETFRDGCVSPERHHHDMTDGVGPGTLLIMPAWQHRLGMGVKLVSVFPDNRTRGLPAIAGLYVLFDPQTGVPVATFDGGELTARRTAAASAMAARYMARRDASVLTVVGTGRLSGNLVRAHSQVRTITKVFIWGRDASKAELVVEELNDRRVQAVTDLEAAVRQSDIVSCATLSAKPLVHGAWLQPGVHLDLVGAFKPLMRESDAECWRKADVMIVDTPEGARHEAGDILQAEAEGVPVFARVRGSLTDLARGRIAGRTNDSDITIFKSVGAAQEDLAAAHLALSLAREHRSTAPIANLVATA